MPLATKMKKIDKATGPETMVDVTVDRDECNRPDTTLEGLSALKPVFSGGQQVAQGKYITAGNASQFADGASAAVVMESGEAARRASSRLAFSAASRWPAASPMKWASARSRRCRGFCSATA